jgi:hypothetical protein
LLIEDIKSQIWKAFQIPTARRFLWVHPTEKASQGNLETPTFRPNPSGIIAKPSKMSSGPREKLAKIYAVILNIFKGLAKPARVVVKGH